MQAIQFKTVVNQEQVIRPPDGIALPEGRVEVTVRPAASEGAIPAFEEAQASHGQSKSAKSWRDYWNHVRNGRSPTLDLLASPTMPTEAVPHSSLTFVQFTVCPLPI